MAVVLLYKPNPALQAVVYPMQASPLFQDEKRTNSGERHSLLHSREPLRSDRSLTSFIILALAAS